MMVGIPTYIFFYRCMLWGIAGAIFRTGVNCVGYIVL